MDAKTEPAEGAAAPAEKPKDVKPKDEAPKDAAPKEEAPKGAAPKEEAKDAAPKDEPPKASPDTVETLESILGNNLVECAYCRTDITRCCRIRCADSDCGAHLCATCFSVGVKIEKHRPWHSYRVSTNLSFPAFHEEWTAHEELLLLGGIRQYGLGNWKDISEHIGTKTALKCAEHYWDRYTGRFGAQLPRQAFNKAGEAVPTEQLLADASLLGTTVFEREKFSDDKRRGRPSAAGLAKKEKEKEKEKEEAAAASGSGANGAKVAEDKKLAGAEIHGYMPLRGDFDHEYENDAELLLADMVFEAQEPPADVELKLQVIRIYNRKLDQRQERKDFVVQRGLLDYKKFLGAERRRPKDERDIVSRLRPFSRYMTLEEHERWIESILRSKRLKRRIEELQYYRSIGIQSLTDAAQYEEDKKKFKEEERLRKERESAPYLYSAQTVRRRVATPVELPIDPKAPKYNDVELEMDEKMTMLTAEEQKLCRELKLSATQYLLLKTAVVKNFEESGKATFSLEDAKGSKSGADWTDTDTKAFDYWVSCGWLSTQPGAPPPKRRRT